MQVFQQVINSNLDSIVAFFTLAGTCFGASFVAFQKTVSKLADDLKSHSDATMRKFNGSMTYAICRFKWPIYIMEVKNENGRIAFRMMELNEAYANIFGIKRKDWIGKTDMGAGMPKSLAEAEYARYLRVWSMDQELTYLRDMPDGTQEVYTQMPFADDNGKIVGVLVYSNSNCRKLFMREAKRLGLIETENQTNYHI